MRTDTAQSIRLADYRPSDFLIDTVDLDIRLHPTQTRVIAKLAMKRNPAGTPDAPLVLDGDELVLTSLAIDGRELPADRFIATPDSLTIPNPPATSFVLTVETVLNPSANTKLMGLYRSNSAYCTQCEAEGFRRITYFLDRPDVLSVYTTRIEAYREEAPVLLGNGNPLRTEEAGPGRHAAIWHDPFPKPCYLFALVGGNLDRVSEPFVTMSGRVVELGIYVEPGKAERAVYALDALKRSMRWDEHTFGREYDLDVFNIVAVSDFNMGAMENKGLNVFNDKYVLASPETATDADYEGIERVIAHEYFHNWTGNRITCRDWFQLCLKEGLTVFRDQEFSSDERSRAVHRIGEVKNLRARQFPEDAGPLAHPVRPNQYKEINNFYTTTVYEKGAEIIRMLKTLIGADVFRRGMDLYFERFDGTAATIEQFLSCFSDASGRDLSQFFLWYEQSGTPRVKVSQSFDAAKARYRLDFKQSTPPTPGQPEKQPFVIPVSLGLVTADGSAIEAQADGLENGVFVLDRAEASLTFENIRTCPVPSLFRDFSAPVNCAIDLDDASHLVLLRHDTDPFNRWQAAQTVASRLIRETIANGSLDKAAMDAFASAMRDFMATEAKADPAFAALVLTLPSELDIAREIGSDIDPDAVHDARRLVRTALGKALQADLLKLRDVAAPDDGPYSPDAASSGRRAMNNAALDFITASDPALGEAHCRRQLLNATNMTDRLAALATIAFVPGEAREQELQGFADTYRDEPLVLDKWLAIQALIPEAGTLERITELMQHPTFSLANPNRVRALIGTFAMNNLTQFNRADGKAYDLMIDVITRLDPANPQVAARMLTAFGSWRTMEPQRRTKAQTALERLLRQENLSRDVSDIAQRSLG